MKLFTSQSKANCKIKLEKQADALHQKSKTQKSYEFTSSTRVASYEKLKQ